MYSTHQVKNRQKKEKRAYYTQQNMVCQEQQNIKGCDQFLAICLVYLCVYKNQGLFEARIFFKFMDFSYFQGPVGTMLQTKSQAIQNSGS